MDVIIEKWGVLCMSLTLSSAEGSPSYETPLSQYYIILKMH